MTRKSVISNPPDDGSVHSSGEPPSTWHAAIEEVMKTQAYQELNAEFQNVAGFDISPKYKTLFLNIWRLNNQAQYSAFTEIGDRSSYNQKNVFYEMINGIVQEKFSAVEYHYRNYSMIEVAAIRCAVKLAQLLPRPRYSQTMALSCARLNFEMEAFFLQARACLDTFAKSVAYYFEGSSRGSIRKLRKYLANNRTQNPKAIAVVQIIDNHSALLGDLETIGERKSKRDTIAHIGHLDMRPLNVIQYASGEVRILPTLESQHDSGFSQASETNLLQQTMDQLYGFMSQVYAVIFET